MQSNFCIIWTDISWINALPWAQYDNLFSSGLRLVLSILVSSVTDKGVHKHLCILHFSLDRPRGLERLVVFRMQFVVIYLRVGCFIKATVPFFFINSLFQLPDTSPHWHSFRRKPGIMRCVLRSNLPKWS